MNTIEGGLLCKFGNLPPYELEEGRWLWRNYWMVPNLKVDFQRKQHAQRLL